MANGDILALKLHGIMQDQNCVTTLHYEVTAQSGAEEELCQSLAYEWGENLITSFLALMNDDYTLLGLRADARKAAAGTLVPGFYTSGDPGVVSGTASLASTAGTVTLYVDSANPRHRGRVMFPGRTVTDFDASGGLTNVTALVLEGFVDTLREPLVGSIGTYQLCVYSKALDVAHDIVAHRAQSAPAVLRSRRIRGYSIG